jgi:hypothetical protein
MRPSAGDLDTLQSVETTATEEKISTNENKRAVAVSGPTPEGVTLLMSSTPLAYRQVVSRHFVSSGVLKSGVSTGQLGF